MRMGCGSLHVGRYIGIRYKIRNFVVDLFHSEPRTASKPVVQKSMAETEDQSEPRKTKNQIFLRKINQGK
jgi:hypothetical protein